MDVPASFDLGGGCYQEKATGGCHIYLSINTKHGQKKMENDNSSEVLRPCVAGQ